MKMLATHYEWNSFSTGEAVEVVSKVACELIDEAWKTAEKLVTDLSSVRLHLPPRKTERHYFVITGPRRLTLHVHFSNVFINSIERARLKVTIFRAKDDWDEESENEIFETYDFRPKFDKEMRVYWTDSNLTFTTTTTLVDFAFDKFATALEADTKR
jgi:hypothetical protein